jgi:ABC-type tungstate transport system permease subunit
MAINPEIYPGINNSQATQMIEFLTSPEIQNTIANYGLSDFGAPLFSPIAKLETASKK